MHFEACFSRCFCVAGPLADGNIVRSAIRKDNALSSRRSFENIFRFVRADIEEVLVDRLQAEVPVPPEYRHTSYRMPVPGTGTVYFAVFLPGSYILYFTYGIFKVVNSTGTVPF